MTLIFTPPKFSFGEDSSILIELSSDTTDYKWGKLPTERSIKELLDYGIINLDKPPRPTSHEVVSYVKKMLNLKKAGHSGTLDPLVTGVLPIALGRATKILGTLLLAGKEYVCNMRLHQDVREERIKEIMEEFVGDIYQRPPFRSSVKRVLRVRKVYENKILEIKDREVLFWVRSQAGFYVRKYAHDIGQSLACGAHMKELRRVKSGPFSENSYLSSLQDLFDAYMWLKEENDEIPLRNVILPMELGVSHLPKIYVKDSTIDSLCHGAPLAIPGISKYTNNFAKGEMVGIFSLKHELISLGEAQLDSKELIEKNQGLAASVKRVIMEIGTYPSKKKDN